MNFEPANYRAIKDIAVSIKDIYIPISYTKINKLIMALFMVTDIIDEKESVRARLRTLGVELISDVLSVSYKTEKELVSVINKTSEVLTFLEIASSVRIISQMNYSILKKEFLDLKKSLLDYKNTPNFFADRMSVVDFLSDIQPSKTVQKSKDEEDIKKSKNEAKGEPKEVTKKESKILAETPLKDLPPTRIGVQKASDFMSAFSSTVSDRMSDRNVQPMSDRKGESMSDRNVQPMSDRKQDKENDTSMSDRKPKARKPRRSSTSLLTKEKIDLIKQKRKDDLLSLLKTFSDGATISDIRKFARGDLALCSEKTLQRDLLNLLTDNVLYKTGGKRWVKYHIKTD